MEPGFRVLFLTVLAQLQAFLNFVKRQSTVTKVLAYFFEVFVGIVKLLDNFLLGNFYVKYFFNRADIFNRNLHNVPF